MSKAIIKNIPNISAVNLGNTGFGFPISPLQPPRVTRQPASYAVNPGSQARFVVAATGYEPLTYQWRKNGVNILSATNVRYELPLTSKTDEGLYDAMVSNPLGREKSAAAFLSINDPVGITIPLLSSAVNFGDSTALFVEVSGTPPFQYQWRLSGIPLAGATNTYYTISAATSADRGYYDVIVTNIVNSVTSTPAQLVVDRLPAIVVEPISSQNVFPGTPIVISVSAVGLEPLSYQWKKHTNSYLTFADVPGATSSTLTILSATEDDDSNYMVVVTNEIASTTSKRSFVNVYDKVGITAQPINITVDPRTVSVLFSVAVSGDGEFAYQWYKGSVPVSGATDREFKILNTNEGVYEGVLESDQGYYSASITNSISGTQVSSITSNSAYLDVSDKVGVISTSATNLNPYVSNPVTLTVTATGGAPITYQWYRTYYNNNLASRTIIPSATANQYTIPYASKYSSGSYDVEVSNPHSTTNTVSSTYTLVLSVKSDILFVNHPQPTTVNIGDSLQLSVSAIGINPALAYQWYKDDKILKGYTNRLLNISPIKLTDKGSYYVFVADPAANVSGKSNTAAVEVGVPVAIIREPLSGEANPNNNFTFTVIASGGLPLTYNWFKDSIIVPQATTSTYTLTGITENDEGVYYVRATNNLGSSFAYSTSVSLSVNDPIGLIASPSAQSAKPGDDVTFTVEVTGTRPTYKWYKDNSLLSNYSPDATSIVVVNVDESKQGYYQVVVSGAVNTVSSTPVFLDIQNAVQVLSASSDLTVNPGDTVTMFVSAIGTKPLSYQWYKNTTDIPGATLSSYTKNNIIEIDQARYNCTLTNADGGSTVYINLSVNDPIGFVSSGVPQSSAIRVGDSYTFISTLSGTEPIYYQWLSSSTGGVYSYVHGATASSLSITDATSSNVGYYKLSAHNMVNPLTAIAALSVISPITQVIINPSTYLAYPGETVTFISEITGTRGTYLWLSGQDVIMQGKTLSSLSVTASAYQDTTYKLSATNLCNSLTASTTLTVITSGWSASNNTYYIGGVVTTLDQTGTGTWSCVMYLNGAITGPVPHIQDGYDFCYSHYYIGGNETTLNNSGNGDWNNRYYEGGNLFTGGHNGAWYINGELTTLDNVGTGEWNCNNYVAGENQGPRAHISNGYDSCYSNYYIGGTATTLTSSGSGVWSGDYYEEGIKIHSWYATDNSNGLTINIGSLTIYSGTFEISFDSTEVWDGPFANSSNVPAAVGNGILYFRDPISKTPWGSASWSLTSI